MINPAFFLSRAILVAIIATFAVVALKVVASMLGLGDTVTHMIIGIPFAAGLAFAGALYGHQHPKKNTAPRALQTRIFLVLFALFIFILSSLQFQFLGQVSILGHDFPGAQVYIPAIVAIWYVYWAIKNVLNISEEHANKVMTTRSEIFTLAAGVLFAPFLLLIPGFSLAQVFNFDPQLILSVFMYAPIMSAALPMAFSVRRILTHSNQP